MGEVLGRRLAAWLSHVGWGEAWTGAQLPMRWERSCEQCRLRWPELELHMLVKGPCHVCHNWNLPPTYSFSAMERHTRAIVTGEIPPAANSYEICAPLIASMRRPWVGREWNRCKKMFHQWFSMISMIIQEKIWKDQMQQVHENTLQIVADSKCLYSDIFKTCQDYSGYKWL